MASGNGTQGDTENMMDLSRGTQIELSISCIDLPNLDMLSKSDPFCILYMKDPGTTIWREKNRTETIEDNLSPEFVTKFLVDYSFGDTVELKFELYDENQKSRDLSKQSYIGSAEVMLGEIVSTKGGLEQKLTGPKKHSGNILVAGLELDSCKDLVHLEWSGIKLDKMDTIGKSDPFLVIHRQNADQGYTAVHRTEVIKNTLNPEWKPFEITVSKLCNGDPHRQLKIECWDWNRNGKHAYMGMVLTTLHQLKSGHGNYNTYDCVNEIKLKKLGHGKYKRSGQIKLKYIVIVRKPTFVEYLLGGTELHCTFAVDFGQADGELHQLDPGQPNLYQQAIRAVGTVMESYDRYNSFPTLGFGAKVPPNNMLNHCFYMNGHAKNPNCQNLDGVLKAYEHAVNTVTLSGPTNMAPSIEYVTRLAEDATPGEHYHVLVILTSGTVHDMAQTCSTIVDAATLPLSIILVGIGNHDFKDMETLDGDDERLMAGSKPAERDIVQFVPFRDHVQKGDSSEISQKRLARAVLEEVPDQLISYMEMNKIEPRPIGSN